jgi:hypothetical protein
LIVHRQPAEGEYRLISIHAAGDEVTPLDMASGIRVADVFAG